MKTTVADYVLRKLANEGVEHIFGVPGDYFLNFFQKAEQKLQVVNTCDEQGAGFAADAYARLKGFGAVCVTYGAGALKIVNTTAQAKAEKSPVLIISGAPTLKEQHDNLLVHHRVNGFDMQYKIFKQITTASARLTKENALTEIDRIFHEVKTCSCPGYIEIPLDLVDCELDTASSKFPSVPQGQEGVDQSVIEEALTELSGKLQNAKQPVVMVGIDVHRWKLEDKVRRWLDKNGIPFVTNRLSKSVLPETYPNFIGVYEGGGSKPEVRKIVEESDCLLMLGVLYSDLDMGDFTARFNWKNTICVSRDKTNVGFHSYEKLNLRIFTESLLPQLVAKQGKTFLQQIKQLSLKSAERLEFRPDSTKKITVDRTIECVGSLLKNSIVIPDTGISLYGSSDMLIPENSTFLSSNYYASMGFAMPAALGAQLACRQKRPVVLLGDGCFQMTGMELSTILRFQLSPIIIVLNNRGYSTERFKGPDGKFNDILNWNYSKVTDFLGGGKGCKVQTEQELCDALKGAMSDSTTAHVIELALEPKDFGAPLLRLKQAKAMSQ